jgi:hypothetical protein
MTACLICSGYAGGAADVPSPPASAAGDGGLQAAVEWLLGPARHGTYAFTDSQKEIKIFFVDFIAFPDSHKSHSCWLAFLFRH